MPLIDHISLSVSNLVQSKSFYSKALAPLGIGVAMEIPQSVTGNVDIVGFGKNGKGELWVAPLGKQTPPAHIAFLAASRGEVDAFYQAAMAAGGKDNGGPGVRPHYHEHYYGAFVLDPDGNNIEAVCHRPAK
jgi:catechol 2,3-dioxygenase-like lactoylglutathione lyase family enzyme